MAVLIYDQTIHSTFEVVASYGDERLCRCIWHNDTGRPNLYVNAKTGLYLCYSCGAKGSIGKNLQGVTSIDRLRLARERMHEGLDSNDIGVVHHSVRPESWLDQFDVEHPYWKQRGFGARTIRRFRLGYDVLTDQAVIPLRNINGQPTGVIFRRLDDQKPKYMHPVGFKMGRTLYGSWLVRRMEKAHRVALVEGPLDAIACWDARVPALAMFGARLTSDQAKLLVYLGVESVVAMTDNDVAGDGAVLSIRDTLKGKIPMLVAQYPTDAKDPNEVTPHVRREMFREAVPFRQVVSA